MSELKQQFIDAIRQTPSGIDGFLTAEIPDPPSVDTPADIDAAIIVNGVCAKYVLDLFRPFAGLTIVELMLRIGQHNSVLESAMLSGLEYLTDSQAEHDFEIVEPTDGTVYYPGEMRITAISKNDTVIKSMTGAIGDDTFEMKAFDGEWRQYVNLMDAGEFTLTLTATFPKGEPSPQTVTFTISDSDPGDPDPPDDPEPPGGDDEPAVDEAKKKFQDALKKFLADATSSNLNNLLNAVNLLKSLAADVSDFDAAQDALDWISDNLDASISEIHAKIGAAASWVNKGIAKIRNLF